MDAAFLAWAMFRIVRWLAWIGLAVYSVWFLFDRGRHFDAFGQLLHSTEAAMFGFTLAAVFAGLFELMMRERAGLERPNVGQLVPARKAAG